MARHDRREAAGCFGVGGGFKPIFLIFQQIFNSREKSIITGRAYFYVGDDTWDDVESDGPERKQSR